MMHTILRQMPNYSNFIRGRFTVDIGYPWLTYGAILMLEQLKMKDFNILEFGSGGSTIFFANRVKHVTSFDTNKEWVSKVKGRADKDFPNITINCGIMDSFLKFLKNEPDRSYDLILIDSDPKLTNRLELAKMSASKLKMNGWMIIDNYGRWGLRAFAPKGWKMYTFDDVSWNGNGTRILQKY